MKKSNECGVSSPVRGTLYLVGTPIGNLEDMTWRAVRVLKEVSLIACEDTRQTQKLLHHYDIHTAAVSYHDHNEVERSAELILRLEQGSSIALVSDAGTPCISDPGYKLVNLAISRRIPVVPIPGPCAFISALIASGLPVDSFHFGGFLPAKSGQRRTALEALRTSRHTKVFYETPRRIHETLQDIVELLGGQRSLVIAREITKLHEEFLRGSAAELLERLGQQPARGEITLLIAPAARTAESSANANLRQRVEAIMAGQSLDEKAALKVAAKERGMSRSEAYREWQRLKGGK